jgi:hypothetical protein
VFPVFPNPGKKFDNRRMSPTMASILGLKMAPCLRDSAQKLST